MMLKEYLMLPPPKTTLKDKFLCEKKINQLTTEIDLAQAFSWV